MTYDASIFWDEERQVSELSWHGHTVTGTNEDTYALMLALNGAQAYRDRVIDAAEKMLKQASALVRIVCESNK